MWFLCLGLHIILRTFSFICQGTSTRRQRRDLFCLPVELPSVTTIYPLKGRVNLVKCLAQEHNKRTFRRDIHTVPLMLKVKQGSRENNLLGSYYATTLIKSMSLGSSTLLILNKIWYDFEGAKVISIYFLVQFSSPFCKYVVLTLYLIRDQVLINIDSYDP